MHTVRSFELPAADAPLLSRLERLAQDCWTLLGLRGWARVDVRVDESGRPWVLEINANPCLAPDAGFAAALVFMLLMPSTISQPRARAVSVVASSPSDGSRYRSSTAGSICIVTKCCT